MTAIGVRAAERSAAAALLLRSALAVAVIDGLFAIAVYVVVLHRTTVPRLFQGIASTLLGPAAFKGGIAAVGVGLSLHLAVALAWSTVFLVLLRGSPALRRVLSSPSGPVRIAAWYGPFIYLAMSLAIIPLFTHRLPKLDAVWLTILLGHIPFVALPITWTFSRAAREG